MALFRHLNERELPIDVEILYAGRRRVIRKFTLPKDGSVDDVLLLAYGTQDFGEVTACLTGYANLKLVKQTIVGGKNVGAPSLIVQIFETLTTTLAPEGADKLVTSEDGRTACQFSYIGLPAATGGKAVGDVFTFRGVSVVVTKADKEVNDAYLRVVYDAVQATSTLVHINDDKSVASEDGRIACQLSYIGTAAATGGLAVGDVTTFNGISVVVAKAEAHINAAYKKVVYDAIQATATLTKIDDDKIVVSEDGRTACRLSYVGTAAATGGLTVGDVITFRGVSVVVVKAETQVNAAYTRIVYDAVQATTSPVLLGDVTEGEIPNAYIGTSATPNFEYVDGTTKAARSWTYHYLVSGDGTVLNSNWLALNSTLAATGDLPLRYLVESQVTKKGIAYSIISRLYYEKPATFSYPQEMQYNYVGVFKQNAPSTSLLTATIKESYHVDGPPSRTTLGFNLKKYLTIFITSRIAGDVEDISTEEYRSGWIGDWTGDFTNCTINGIKYDTYSVGSDSDPTSLPIGVTVISSKIEHVKGQMWKKIDTSIDFADRTRPVPPP